MEMMSKRIIIGGGGTGGHIFPAIAIADAIKSIAPETQILFVGANHKLEMEKVPEAGYEIIGLPVAGLQRRLTYKNLTFVFKLLSSMIRSARIIKNFKPNLVLGVGGYASGPILKAATRKNIPIVIQEQNSYAGLTNRLLSRKAAKIFVAYEGMEKFFSKDCIVFTGNPIRQDINELVNKSDEAWRFFGLNKAKTTVLIIGGSLGARTINESILTKIDKLPENLQILWQTGKLYADEILKDSLISKNENVKVMPFIKKMNLAFSVADIIVSRAGAGTISELSIVGKPVILIPSPNVAEDHQTKNAMALVEKNAALCIKDHDAGEKLVDEVIRLSGDQKLMNSLSANIKKMALPNSAKKIAEEILKMI
jgi:UDP-N-acetylglucosamine--N-acetylmuramyl-(pentapeptide) pyrophosphoryl-undecaprenol N-acetylglucosamine transferase